jgi:asparagine synthase (glutamine-hydrolysing)
VYDESRYARLVANRLGTRHEEIVLTERDVLTAIPRILDHLREPVGDSSIVPTSLVSQVARQLVTVALSGDGGDELFGGYWRYLAHQSLESYLRIPAMIRRGAIEPLVSLLAISRSSSLGNRARQFRKLLRADSDNAMARHLAWSRILPDEATSLFRDPSAVEQCLRSMLDRIGSIMAPGSMRPNLGHPSNGGQAAVADPLNAILHFDLMCQLPADMLHKVDLASMMHSLEVRVPLLDQAVIAAAAQMPSSWKIHRGLRKRILLDAYRGHLPDEVLDRPKQGFEVPIGEMLRGPLRDLFHDVVRRDVIDSLGILSHPAVQSIYEAHSARRADFADVLWAILSLCWWQSKC